MTGAHPRIVEHARAGQVPAWALAQRQLFELMDRSEQFILDHYLTPDGEIFWPDVEGFGGYGGVDNIFEGFHRWPLFYVLGGHDRWGDLAQRQYETLVRQFSSKKRRGGGGPPGRDTMLVEEYLPGFDWMHAGEAALFFYYLNLARPDEPANIERSVRFAGYLLDEGTAEREPAYDHEHRVFRTIAMGSNGPAFERFGGSVGYGTWMDHYGLAFYDVPGVDTLLDLKDPEKAARYGEVYARRLRNSDTVTNLLATSMALNAYLHTGENLYRDWILDYVGAWRERYAATGGPMPDNAGPHGVVGETIDGKWYGGHYGWTFPHGFQFIGDALVVGGQNERLLNGETGRLDWTREQIEILLEHGFETDEGRLLVPQKYADPDSAIEYGGAEALTRPDRITDEEGFNRKQQRDGWYEFRPLNPAHMAYVYADTRAAGDMEVIRRSRGSADTTALELTGSVHGKDYSGQQQAWLHFLDGAFRDYPEQALQYSIDRVYAQLCRLQSEQEGVDTSWGYRPYGDKAWAEVSEVTRQVNAQKETDWSESVTHSYFQTYMIGRSTMQMETLVQLTMGGPLPVYNGGLLNVAVRHFDADRRRPGLPPDVAALVHGLHVDSIDLTLVNTHPTQTRRTLVQAGAFGEHRFGTARWKDAAGAEQVQAIDATHVEVELGPGAVLDLHLEMERTCQVPSYSQPWD